MFMKMDQSGVMGIDKLVRIRVLLDVRKPLVSSVRVKMKDGMEETFDVRYERPPLYCFYCGKVGHGSKDCDEGEDDHGQEIKYGGGLKLPHGRQGSRRKMRGDLTEVYHAQKPYLSPNQNVIMRSKPRRK